ncbi:PIN domain-containing protein [Uliginosibacterium sediminicola]|uniref:PIN domain-containing protein n=1 Tax=Uliginosibacterium sediminicola TaxID=2024550 RepID=A0ABU9YYX7_9RHOO
MVPEALEIFNRQHGCMALSAITVAELVHGAEKSCRPEQNLAVVEDFCSRLAILPYGEREAFHYGSIRATLERLGQPIGVNDLHIAAHARAQGLTLVSNKLRQFERVPGLLTENWI